MHRHIKKLVIAFLFCTLLTGCGEDSKADSLALYAEEQFMANDYETYIQKLRAASGLSDLDAELSTHYYFEYDYDKNSKTLNAEGHLSFKSDEIDKYYTTTDDKDNSIKLAEILNALKKEYYKEPIYTYTSSKGTVNLKICNGSSSEIHVSTSSDRDYELSYYVNYDEVDINGKMVYMEKARNEDHVSTPNNYTGSYDAKLSYGSGSVLICISEDAMDRYMKALNNNYQGTIDEMTTNGEIAFTEKDTKCNIVDKKLTKAKVKLLDGSYAGNTVWVIIESLHEK